MLEGQAVFHDSTGLVEGLRSAWQAPVPLASKATTHDSKETWYGRARYSDACLFYLRSPSMGLPRNNPQMYSRPPTCGRPAQILRPAALQPSPFPTTLSAPARTTAHIRSARGKMSRSRPRAQVRRTARQAPLAPLQGTDPRVVPLVVSCSARFMPTAAQLPNVRRSR